MRNIHPLPVVMEGTTIGQAITGGAARALAAVYLSKRGQYVGRITSQYRGGWRYWLVEVEGNARPRRVVGKAF